MFSCRSGLNDRLYPGCEDSPPNTTDTTAQAADDRPIYAIEDHRLADFRALIGTGSADTKIVTEVSETSPLLTGKEVLYLAGYAAMVQELTGMVLSNESFERGYSKAARAVGREVAMPQTLTHSGGDLIVDGIMVECKSETTPNLHPNLGRISKLASLGATRTMATRADARNLIEPVLKHVEQIDTVLYLRAVRNQVHSLLEEQAAVRYDLFEFDKGLLNLLDLLSPRDFSTPARKGGVSTAKVRDIEGSHVYSINFDGSAGKVALRNIRLDMLTRRASFWVPQDSLLDGGGGPDG